MPPNREMILQRLRAGLPDLRREFPLGRLALFGSVVRDEATGASDIDILVEVEPSIGLAFVILADRLESLMDIRSIWFRAARSNRCSGNRSNRN